MEGGNGRGGGYANERPAEDACTQHTWPASRSSIDQSTWRRVRDAHHQRDDERAGGTRGRARATANPAASTHTNEFTRFDDKAGARDSARVHCPDSQALTATTYTERRSMSSAGGSTEFHGLQEAKIGHFGGFRRSGNRFEMRWICGMGMYPVYIRPEASAGLSVVTSKIRYNGFL